jgi:hypothetical protein
MGHSKGSPKRKLIATSVYIKNAKRSQINDLMLDLKLPEKKKKRTS